MPKSSPLLLAPMWAGPALVLSSAPALANGYGQESSLPFLDSIVDWIGFVDISGGHRDLFGYSLIGFALVFGYLTDLALKGRGLGKFGNGLVGIAGICVALHFYLPYQALLPEASEKARFNLAMIAAGAGASLALFVAALVKGFVLRRLNLGLDRLRRPARPAAIRLEPQLDPRIAAATRKKV